MRYYTKQNDTDTERLTHQTIDDVRAYIESNFPLDPLEIYSEALDHLEDPYQILGRTYRPSEVLSTINPSAFLKGAQEEAESRINLGMKHLENLTAWEEMEILGIVIGIVTGVEDSEDEEK